jgi:two-component system, OmpR family, phosphate regulon sensor histidine kinase PhoR
MKSRLFLKIFLGYFAILLIVISLDSLIVASYSRAKITNQIREELSANAQLLALMPKESLLKKLAVFAEATKSRITFVESSGKVVADSDTNVKNLDSHLDRSEIQEARLKGHGSHIRYSQTLKTDMLYYAISIKEDGRISGYIRLAKPIEDVKIATGYFNQIVFRTAVIILISFLLIALIFLPRLILPILKITAYTDKVKRNEKHGNLIINSHDEIGILAQNINLMVQSYREQIRIAHEEREKLELIFTSLVEGILVLNNENRIELISKSLQNILGYKYGQIAGKTPLEAFHNADLQDALEKFHRTGTPVLREIVLGEDSSIYLHVNISAVKDITGITNKIILVFHDVTQLKKLERMRADFVANVTHEIKTPLTAIIGYTQTLQQGAIEDKNTAQTFLQTIHDNAQRLNRLVDDLLILSSIELGRMQLKYQSINVGESIAKAIAVVEEKAQVKGIAINRDWPDDLPPIFADADRIAQILVNILDNAVKFTPAGNISVSAAMNDQGYIVIKVADTGLGIPKREISRLGERFYRVDKTRSRELGGTGLGLSIVKHLLQAQNGRMEIKSQLDKGTEVSLFFPVKK